MHNFNFGDIVVTDFGSYQHYSIVTDAYCADGLPKLISATKRNGTVREESWSEVTQGKHTYIADIKSERPINEMLNLARSQIDIWSYSLLNNNCEHFVMWVAGLQVSSKQVIGTLSGLATGVTVGLSIKNPTVTKVLCSGALGALSGLLITKAIEKK